MTAHVTGTTVPAARSVPQRPAATDRRLRLDDILKLMVADGLITSADAESSRADAHVAFRAPAGSDRRPEDGNRPSRPDKVMTLEWLVEWLAGKLGVPYLHIDPLKIDLSAVTATMTNAYADRYRILPVAVDRMTLTVATGEPFVRSFAEELEKDPQARRQVRFQQSAGHQALPRRVLQPRAVDEKSAGRIEGRFRLRAQFRAAGRAWQAAVSSTPTTSTIVHIVDWLWQYAFEQRASTFTWSRSATSAWCGSASTACCTRSTRYRRSC